MEVRGTLLFIGNFLPVPRYNKNIWHFLAEKLTGLGWNVIVTSDKERQLPRLADMLLTIWKQRKNYKVAHIDVFSGKAFIFAWLTTYLLKALNKTIVLTLHGGGLADLLARRPEAVGQVLRAANVVVTPSAFLQNAFTQVRDDILLIPNPVDLREAIFRERRQVAPSLVWVRAFHSVYNPTMAVKVVSLLEKSASDVSLTMIGPDKGDGSLGRTRKTAADLGVSDRIEIVGHVVHSEIPKWLDRADIFINTSNYDTAPRSLLEAMANGLCVISTRVGGIPLLAQDGSEDLLVDPGDAEGMANAVQRVLNDQNLAHQLSVRARLRAEAFDWEKILPRWDALFERLVEAAD